jgi:hypothetical protein
MRKIVLKHILAVFISGIFLSISAATEEQDKLPEDLDLHGSDCIWIRSNESLLIHASGKRSYFVRLSMPGFGLKSSFQLATRSRDDNLCPYGGDSIIFDRFAGGEARILSISRLTPDQVEMLLIRYGKKEPVDTEETPVLPEVKGAEVEELG